MKPPYCGEEFVWRFIGALI